jgi:hypothetical protein
MARTERAISFSMKIIGLFVVADGRLGVRAMTADGSMPKRVRIIT